MFFKPFTNDSVTFIWHRDDRLLKQPIFSKITQTGFAAWNHIKATLIFPMTFD